MSEEEDALFWRVDTPSNPVSGKKSAEPALDSTEATPVKGLCLEATTLAEPAVATSVPTVESRAMQVAPVEITQDTKPAMQHRATNTVDADEI